MGRAGQGRAELSWAGLSWARRDSLSSSHITLVREKLEPSLYSWNLEWRHRPRRSKTGWPDLGLCYYGATGN